MAVRFPQPRAQFFKTDGTPAADYVLYVYLAGSTTPADVYSDADDTTADNPYELDARGECDLWLDPALSYKFILKTAVDGTSIWTIDDVSVDITPEEGTFSVSASGPFAAEAVTVRYFRRGKQVFLQFPQMLKAGNSVAAAITLNFTNMPASIRPEIQMQVPCALVRDDGVDQEAPGVLQVPTSGSGALFLNGGDSTFTLTSALVGWSAFTAAYLTA